MSFDPQGRWGALARADALKLRTRTLALRVIRVVRCLPNSHEGRVIGGQMLRSATSVAANYRAVCRARSPAEFRAKLGIGVEEADETVFWLELLADSGTIPRPRLANLLREANEVLAIVAAALNTAKRRSARRT